MTDAGYVLGGYAVTVVAIGAYIGHMWARNRTIVRLTATPQRSGHVSGASGAAKRDQNAVVVTSDGPSATAPPPDPETAPPPPGSGGRSGPPDDRR